LNNADGLELKRVELAQQLSEISSALDIFTFQVALADSIRAAESLGDRGEAKFHINLLRRMGDALTSKALSQHAIRELGRDRGKPAHLAGQGLDFDFVLDTACVVANAGAAPIVVDLTTLLAVGDIVVVQPGPLLIIECKNRTVPRVYAPRGRLWRQQRRRDDAVNYLRDDERVEGDGTHWIAYDGVMVEPRNDSLIAECILSAENSESGVGWRRLGERDYIVAVWNYERDREATQGGLSEALREMKGDEWTFPFMDGGAEFMRTSSPWVLNPFTLEIDVRYQIGLAEGRHMLWRFADILPIVGQVPGCEQDVLIRCSSESASGFELFLVVGDEEYRFSNRFLEEVGLGFVAVRAVRDTMHRLAQHVAAALLGADGPARDPQAERPASGNVDTRGQAMLSAVAYRSAAPGSSPILLVEFAQLARLFPRVPVSDLKSLSEKLDDVRDWLIPLQFVFSDGLANFEIGEPIEIDTSLPQDRTGLE
jgi:hypothetical protein